MNARASSDGASQLAVGQEPQGGPVGLEPHEAAGAGEPARGVAGVDVAQLALRAGSTWHRMAVM